MYYLDILRRIQLYLEFIDKVVNFQLQSKLEYILWGRWLSLSPSYNNNVEYKSNMIIKIEIKIIAILKLLFLITIQI